MDFAIIMLSFLPSFSSFRFFLQISVLALSQSKYLEIKDFTLVIGTIFEFEDTKSIQLKTYISPNLRLICLYRCSPLSPQFSPCRFLPPTHRLPHHPLAHLRWRPKELQNWSGHPHHLLLPIMK